MVKIVQLGNHLDPSYNLTVSQQGLGTMEIIRSEQKEVIQRAIERGVTFFDTAEMYGSGKSEEVLGDAIKGYDRNQLVISTKVGCTFGPDGIIFDASPEHIEEACDASLKRLGVKVVDLYFLHRVDPKTPLEESIRAMKKLVEAGKVRCIGLSEVTEDQIRRAHEIHPITAVQIEFSLWSQQDKANRVINTCHELGIGILAYSPLGRKFFVEGTGKEYFGRLKDDIRCLLPRYNEHLSKNLEARKVLESYALRLGVKVQQLVLSWIMAQGIVPIPGTTKVPHLLDNLEANTLQLTPEQVEEIGLIGSFVGKRYPSPEVSGIFSEKRLAAEVAVA